MKRTLFYTLILFSGLTVISITSCKKETPDTETQSTVDNAFCEGEFTNILPLVNSYAITQQGIKTGITAGLTVDTSAWPRKITLDFGTTGLADTVNGDGRLRTGKIRISFDMLWHTIGATATVSLDTYAVAKSAASPFIQYSATSITIKHTGNGLYAYKITGGKCTGNGWALSWDSDRTVTQTGGLATVDNADDEYSTMGSSTGTDRNGKTYSVNITHAITKRTACPWMESGTLDLTPAGLSARTIDYGTAGTCDSKASLTIDGNTFTFNLN